jgi:hypothetical protein
MTYLSLILQVLKFFNWIVGWLERQKAKQEGRQEVIDAVEKKKKEVDAEVEKLRNTDTTFDAAVDRMRKRSSG